MRIFGLVQSWVAASSAAWGWQGAKSGVTIPKSSGFEAATRYGATNQCYPESDLFEPSRIFHESGRLGWVTDGVEELPEELP